MTLALFATSSAFTLGLLGLTLNRVHLLSALLCLEGMMLSLFMALSLWMLQLATANFSAAPLLMLALSACEASAGLALLVASTRTHGSDHIQSFNLLQC
nr:NADH dehydrogenase subunit 4L [Abantennarius coccineus]